MARDLRHISTPIGPYKDKRVVAIGAADFVLESGFTCQAAAAGNIQYRTLKGEQDTTENGLAVGDTITGPGGIPVVLRAIRGTGGGTTTVASVVIGIP